MVSSETQTRTQLSAEIDLLKSTITSAKGDQEILHTRIKLHEKRQTELEGRITTRDEDIVYLKKKLDKTEGRLSSTIESLESHEDKYQKLDRQWTDSNLQLTQTIAELASERAAHSNTQQWTKKTLRYKDQEIAQLRKTVENLSVN